MRKCAKCGKSLGIFSAKHKLEDAHSFACPECFEQIEIEKDKIDVKNSRIMKDYIKKYLNNNGDLCFTIRNIYENLTSLVDPHSLERIKTTCRIHQLSLESNKEGLDIDTIMFNKSMNESSIRFLNDLEKLEKVFHNKGIDTDYLKILSLFLESINEDYTKVTEDAAEFIYKTIINLSGENPSQEDIVRLAKPILAKGDYSLDFNIEIILKLFRKFKFHESKEGVRNLLIKIEEDDELSDFEENLGSQQETCLGDFRELDGRQFEVYLKKLFEALKFTVIRTKLSGDQGADLIISKDDEKIVVQIKKYSADVSNKAIQEAVAAKNYYKADKALVVTNSFFTKGAIDLALANKVELWDGKKLAAIVNDMNKTSDKTPEDGMRYSEEGIKLVDEGKYDEAILKFTKALKLLPNFVVPYYYRGLAYLRKGEFDKSIADCNKAIEIDPNFLLALLVRGDASAAKGEHAKALLDFSDGIERSSDIEWSCQFYAKRGGIYMIQEEIDKAIRDFDKAIEIEEDWAEVYHNRALCYYVIKEYDKAWEDVHKAEELGYSGNPKLIGLIENLQKASGRMK